MDLPALRRILLDLFGTARTARTAGLGAAEWDWIDHMAGMRRLRPLLHVQHQGDPSIPARIAQSWRAAYREAALLALARRAELEECVGLLEDAGFAPLALKGAWLATHAYPDPAQRPMYDIDLLLDSETVVAGWELLKRSGYVEAYPAEMPLAHLIRFEKHLPTLIGPRGSSVEVHHRLWEPDGRLDHHSPAPVESEIRARALRQDGIAYPCPADMLAHLIIHCVYSSRFDCGPRVLADIDMLLRREAIDWDRFWQRADSEGWRGGARLLLDLTADYRAGVAVEFTPAAGPPSPAEMKAGAVQLFLQEPGHCASAGFAASLLRQGWRGLADRAAGRRRALGEASASRDMAGEGGRLRWAGSRLLRVAGDLAQADVRRQASELARLSKWLDR